MTARASTARSRSHGRETGPSVFHHPFFFFTSPSGATPLRWHNPRPTQCFVLSAGGQYRHAPCQVSVRGDEVAGSTPGVVVCSREPGLDRETVPGHQAHQPCPAPPTVFHTGARGRGKERVLPAPAAPADEEASDRSAESAALGEASTAPAATGGAASRTDPAFALAATAAASLLLASASATNAS